MRAVLRTDHRLLAEASEKGLRGLGYVFLKNGGGNTTEFEIQSPCSCVVSVQNLSREQLGYPFRPRTRVESMIEIRRLVGGESSAEVLRKTAESIADALSSEVPRKKWKGLDDFSSG